MISLINVRYCGTLMFHYENVTILSQKERKDRDSPNLQSLTVSDTPLSWHYLETSGTITAHFTSFGTGIVIPLNMRPYCFRTYGDAQIVIIQNC